MSELHIALNFSSLLKDRRSILASLEKESWTSCVKVVDVRNSWPNWWILQNIFGLWLFISSEYSLGTSRKIFTTEMPTNKKNLLFFEASNGPFLYTFFDNFRKKGSSETISMVSACESPPLENFSQIKISLDVPAINAWHYCMLSFRAIVCYVLWPHYMVIFSFQRLKRFDCYVWCNFLNWKRGFLNKAQNFRGIVWNTNWA